MNFSRFKASVQMQSLSVDQWYSFTANDKNRINYHESLVIENIVFIFQELYQVKTSSWPSVSQNKNENSIPQLEIFFSSHPSFSLQGYLYSPIFWYLWNINLEYHMLHLLSSLPNFYFFDPCQMQVSEKEKGLWSPKLAEWETLPLFEWAK